MSHHFDTPTGREDPRVNLCDFYLFAGDPGKTVMAMTVNPAATVETCAPFRDEALYVFRFDTDSDAHEEVSFKLKFAEVVHSAAAAGGDAQTFELRLATGADAAQGGSGELIASGTTGVTVAGESGVRVFAGVVHDVFAGNAGLNDFRHAFAAGVYKPEAFANQVNIFRDRTVAGIVVDAPNELISSTTRVQAWATVSLCGHAPEQQVARWGLPMFTHLHLNDDELSEAFNSTAPSGDNSRFVARTIDTVTKYVTLAGTSADPGAYARRVADLFGSMTLPYELGTPASFDYTGMNGRGLMDNVLDNVLSVLTNSPLGAGVAPDPARITAEFPYFSCP